jgi:hypothetical protein
MAKNRSKRQNRCPQKNSQIRLVAVEAGHLLRTNGFRTDNTKMVAAAKDATPVFVGRVYTGINKGKVYPYASKKRGG